MSDRIKILGTVILMLGLVLLYWWVAFDVSPQVRDMLLVEHGPIELASAIFYLLVIVYFAVKFGAKATALYWYIPVALLAAALREADAHKAFTTMSIFKSRFYLSADVPIVEKLAGLAVIILLICVAYLLIARHLSDFIKKLLRFDPSMIAVFVGLGCAGAAKMLDGFIRKLAAVGISVPLEYKDNLGIFEEVIEFGIGLFFIYAIFIYVRSRREAA